MNGQAAIMEYVIMMIMIMFIIFFVLILIFGFQFISAGAGQSEELQSRSLFTLNKMLSSRTLGTPSFHKLSIFDDAKLTVATCEDIETLYGAGVWMKVQRYIEKPNCTGLPTSEWVPCNEERDSIDEMMAVQCDAGNYPDCGYWEFCPENNGERMVYREVPVNIYSKTGNALGIGVLLMGIGGLGT